MRCPQCDRDCDLDDIVYTNILPDIEHPAYMIYAPTCECSHRFIDEEYLVYGDGHTPNVNWFGGIRLEVMIV